jgi:hypothetical protein
MVLGYLGLLAIMGAGIYLIVYLLASVKNDLKD